MGGRGRGRDAWEAGEGMHGKMGREEGEGREGGDGRDLGRGVKVRQKEEGRDHGSKDPATFMVLDRILSPPPPPPPPLPPWAPSHWR